MFRIFVFALLLIASFNTFSKNLSPQYESDESTLTEHNQYTNKNGKKVHSPAHSKSGAAPSGATAKCGDGSFSFSQSHRGTCSRHGGVKNWL